MATPAAVIAAFAALWPAAMATSTSVEAKTPGKTYCFYGKCHRVHTLEETRRLIGVRTTLKASHYDDPKKDRYNPSNLTSSGEWFRASTPDNAASPTLPNGTVLFAYNPSTRQAAVLRINNAGPYWGNRTLDVSRAAAEKLGFVHQGVATLITQVIQAPTMDDVTYRKGRRYAEVPGYIGTHASLELALADATLRMNGAPSPLMPTPGALGTLIASSDLGTGTPPTAAGTPEVSLVAVAAMTSGTAQDAEVASATPDLPPAPAVASKLPGEDRTVPTPPALQPDPRPAMKTPARSKARSKATTLASIRTVRTKPPVTVVASAAAKTPIVTARRARHSKAVTRIAQLPVTAPPRRYVSRAIVLSEYEALPRPARGATLKRASSSRRAADDDDYLTDD